MVEAAGDSSSEPGSEPGPDPSLLDAVSRAARHVGAEEGTLGKPRVSFYSSRGGRGRVVALAVVLVLVASGAVYLSLKGPGDPPALEQEQDLRWAVAQLVRRVDFLRAQTGALPSEDALQGLVSEYVRYEPGDGFYVVVGTSGGVEVVYDGSVPLDVWLMGPQASQEGPRQPW